MIALTALIVIACWGLLGLGLWRVLVKPRIRSENLTILLGVLLAIVWFVGPVFDEILGARQFDKLCREMPPYKFYGPVAVGSGPFFDGQGRPKWKNGDEFYAIRRDTDVWEKEIFERRTERRVIRKWPMPIVKTYSILVDRATGNPSYECVSINSKGGWLRKLIGIGSYQCTCKGQFVHDQEMIFFKTNNE